jgi:hypothetical protein
MVTAVQVKKGFGRTGFIDFSLPRRILCGPIGELSGCLHRNCRSTAALAPHGACNAAQVNAEYVTPRAGVVSVFASEDKLNTAGWNRTWMGRVISVEIAGVWWG